LSGCAVEAPFLEPGDGVFAGVHDDAVTLVGDIKRSRIGKPDAEREKAERESRRGRLGVREEGGKAGQWTWCSRCLLNLDFAQV